MADPVYNRNPAVVAAVMMPKQPLAEQRRIIDHAIRVLLQNGTPGPKVLKMLNDAFFAVKSDMGGGNQVGTREHERQLLFTQADLDAYGCVKAVFKLIMSNYELLERKELEATAATAANETHQGVSVLNIAQLEARIQALEKQLAAKEDSKVDIKEKDPMSLKEEGSEVAPIMRTWPIVKLDRED